MIFGFVEANLVTYDRQEDANLASLLSSLKDMAAAAETSPSNRKLGGSRNGNTMNTPVVTKRVSILKWDYVWMIGVPQF